MPKIRKSAEEIWNRPGVIDPHKINVWITKESLQERQSCHDEGGGLFRLKLPKPRPKKAKRE